MFKKLTLTAVLALVAAVSAQADFEWFNTTTNRIAYNDGSTFLAGSFGDSSVGCFLQLIYAGADNAIDPAVASGDGTTDDDVVASTSWIGRSQFADNAGYMNPFEFYADDSVGYYYVRAWSAPADDFGAGTIPTASTNFYGDSALFDNTSPSTPPETDSFNFGGAGDGSNVGWTTDTPLAAIPEPSIVALALIGVATLRLYRRKKS